MYINDRIVIVYDRLDNCTRRVSDIMDTLSNTINNSINFAMEMSSDKDELLSFLDIRARSHPK